MNELEEKIMQITSNDDYNDILLIRLFIAQCSLTDFEKLKELGYGISQKGKEDEYKPKNIFQKILIIIDKKISKNDNN